MKPACTAPCDQPVTLAIAVEILAHTARSEGRCLFLPGEAMYDGLHVDETDPECYRRADGHERLVDACRACITEALEERTIAAAGEHL